MGLAISLAFAGALASSSAAGTHSHKDWAAVCDNVRDCAAFGFAPESESETNAWLRLSRGGRGADRAVARIALMVDEAPSSRAIALWIDGKPLDIAPVTAHAEGSWATGDLDADATATLVDALRNGTTLELAEAGVIRGSVSLAGSAAALLWVDERQKRLGTETALVRRGPKPASSVPAPPVVPLIAVPKLPAQTKLPTPDLPALRDLIGDCDEDIAELDVEPVVARLSEHEVLFAPLCTRGAYNFVHGFVVLDERTGAQRLLTFAPPPGEPGEPQTMLMNIEFDALTGELVSFSKARGLGDCGDFSTFAWDGREFRPLRSEVMPECRGVMLDQWATLYRAEARR